MGTSATSFSDLDPEPPKEEEVAEILPKDCYFKDGETKVDFVLVFPKLDETIREDRSQTLINGFVAQVKNKGLVVERDVGKHHTTLFFLKIHAPYRLLIRYAKVYNIGLTCQNPYYKYKETIWFNCLATEVTKPKRDSETYKRAEKTLSGARPSGLTTAERSKIVYEILKRISFTSNDDEITLKVMLDREIFLDAYPIHDGDCVWTDEGPLTDRQLLYEFWANLKYIFREQPIHLIEKYYGPKLAFYFALVNLYTKMLVIPTVVGTATVIAGFVMLYQEGEYLEKEVCKSEMVLCSDQKLKTACGLMKIAYIVDNPVTIFYVILCSFWGTVFWSLWQRRQAMLRLRWNLTGVKIDRTMRKEFKESAKTRRSSITGETEYYIPPLRKFLSTVFSYFVIMLMLVVFFLIVYLIVEYRFLLRRSLVYDEVNHANEIELFSSSVIVAVIIIFLNNISATILKFYSKIVRFLTLLRMPRSQAQYDRIYLHMTFIISFANHFFPLFYLAYVKGFFHKYPGDITENPFFGRLQQDLCKPAGCLVDLGMQLIMILIIKTLMNCSLNFLKYLAQPWHRFAIPKDKEAVCGQWEKDFAMRELNQSVINELYVDMVLQYGFITFFNAALPIIGLIALVHNLLKIQHDAFRFLKIYRRPILEKVPDIEGWNQILKVVTLFGIISNAFIVAFRTEFIHRNLYRRENNGSLSGYVNSTLSMFAIKDVADKDIIRDHSNETYCFYRGHRYPPHHEKKYQPRIEYWQHLGVRAVYFIILENFTLILSLVLGYLIPEIPRKVKVKLEHDENVLKAAREAQMEQQVK